MRKLFFAACVATLGCTSINAQEFSFGPKAGVNFATLTGDIEDNDMQVGFHVGGAAEFKFNEKMAVQAELLYSRQGTKDSYSESETVNGISYRYEEEGNIRLDYINIPLSFKYYIVNGFYASAGPQLSILASAKSEYSYSESISGGGFDNSESGSEEYDVKDEVLPIDLGGHIGVGYRMTNGLDFSARYNAGFVNVNDEGDGTVKNSVIQVSVGFMF
ncbi:porin family protein [Mangrovimonas futianensis]|uniref:porin family protein n=1 Tax=Mangrovimonas futianensis TaxID=2895523 RepID=UPI001E514490|nr:porin family protein [Mangrovimonas futianensis]MCF1423019.1 PorT family protein [Mangrovimonas futianensis]